MKMEKSSVVHLVSAVILGIVLGISGGPRALAQFQGVYGAATTNEWGRSVHQLANSPMTAGNIVSVGERTDPALPPNSQTDVYVVMTNGAGAVISEFTIDILGGNDFGKDFTEAANGDIVITGHTTTAMKTDADIFMLQLNPMTGAVAWCRLYSGAFISGNFNDEAYDILDVDGNGYVVAGRSNSNHVTHYDAILFKTDYSGNWMWGTTFDGANHQDECFFSVTELKDGSLDLVAGGYTTNTGNADVFMAQVASIGDTKAAIAFASPIGGSNEGVRRVWACDPLGPSANRILVVGNTGTPASDPMMGLVTLPLSGASTLTGKTYTFHTGDWAEALDGFETPSPEFNFVMTGYVVNPPHGHGFNAEFYIGRTFPTLLLNGYNYHGGTQSDEGWHCDMATGLNGEPYSILAAGLRSTATHLEQLDITRTTQFLNYDCRIEDFPDQPSLTWRAVNMTNCSRFWGLHLQDVTPQARPLHTEAVFCPNATYGTKRQDPEIGQQKATDPGQPTMIQGKNGSMPATGKPVDTAPTSPAKIPGLHFDSNH